MEDMDIIVAENGHPAKRDGIAERGYYESYNGKLYDRNDMRVDVVSGDIVDESGTFISNDRNYMIDKNGHIRNLDGALVKIDEDGFAFTAGVGLISKTQVNGSGSKGGGIDIGPVDGVNKTPKGSGNKGSKGKNTHADGTSHKGSEHYKSGSIYGDPKNEQPLSAEETANCNRINLATLTAAIYFDYDAASADQSSLRQLNRVVDAMQKCAKLQLQVGGYADSDGGENYNYSLSEKRAKSVLKYIMGQGISDERLKFNAYGEKYPLAPNDSDDGKQQNRRAEIQVLHGN